MQIPDNIKMVNCADCGVELLGDSYRGKELDSALVGIEIVAGRINDRPYCSACLQVSPSGVSGICGGHPGPHDDDIGSYRTIAVRSLEDGSQ